MGPALGARPPIGPGLRLFQRDYALLEFLEGAHGLLSAGVVGLVKVENVADLGQRQAQAFAAQDELPDREGYTKVGERKQIRDENGSPMPFSGVSPVGSRSRRPR